MPKVDREFFIVQSEFYTDAPFGTRGNRVFSLEKALREEPDYVVFNGRVGALMGENALRVKAGESVRLYLGNAGPSLLSSFHIVGEIFDNVYGEGGSQVSQHHVQSTLVPVGGSSMVEFVADVPGSYQLVDHSMFRAFNKGAMGAMEVEGAARPDIFSGKLNEQVYNPGTRLPRVAASIPSVSPPAIKPTRAADRHTTVTQGSLERGKKIYSDVCSACHQADGQGMPGIVPPLANSDYLMSDSDRAVRILLEGLSGPITVNGKQYQGVMPNLALAEADIAAVLSYVRTNFGNRGSHIKVDDIARIRASLAKMKQSSLKVVTGAP
jgi:nitrite reductase (NO-forming)